MLVSLMGIHKYDLLDVVISFPLFIGPGGFRSKDVDGLKDILLKDL